MAPEDGASGAPDTLSKHNGLLGPGSSVGVVSNPGRAATASSGGEPAMLAAAGAPSDVDSATAGADSGAGAGAGGAPLVAANACPKLGGEKLVLAGGFCIDENEVTVAYYQAFVASHPSLATQPAACADKLSFSKGCTAADPEKQPQRCVDWCDAHAYCESVGKHLCGSSSSKSGAMPYDASATSIDNQWYSACSTVGSTRTRTATATTARHAGVPIDPRSAR